MPLGTVFPDLKLLGAQAHKELMILLLQDLDCFTSTHPLEQKWVWPEVKMKTGIQSFRITVQNETILRHDPAIHRKCVFI